MSRRDEMSHEDQKSDTLQCPTQPTPSSHRAHRDPNYTAVTCALKCISGDYGLAKLALAHAVAAL